MGLSGEGGPGCQNKCNIEGSREHYEYDARYFSSNNSQDGSRGEIMLGAWEFTIFGNILMGIMAIGGVCCMVYAVGTSMSSASPGEWRRLEQEESSEAKKAA